MPIFGSTKKGYIVLMGIIQFVCLMICATIPTLSAETLTWLLVVYSMGGAFMEVVCQGLMVVESRKDSKSGSEDLQTFAWIMYGVGGSIACLVGGWLDGVWPNGWGAMASFFITAIFVAVLGIGGFWIDPSMEANQEGMNEMGLV